MRENFLSRSGWHVLAGLILFAPLIQGGTPRLPTAVIQIAILAVLALWGYEWGWKAPCQSVRVSLIDILLGLLLFWSFCSLLFAPYQHSAEKALLYLFCFFSLYFWLVTHPSLNGLDRALKALTAQGLILAFLAWYQWLVAGVSRPAGTFFNPNFLSIFLAAAVMVNLGRLLFPAGSLKTPSPSATVFLAAAAAVMGGAVAISGSRGGMLAMVAGLMILLGAKSLRLCLLGTGGLVLGFFAIPNPVTQALLERVTLDVYAYSRFAIWKSSLSMMWDHPLTGVGLAQFKYFSPRYAFPVEAGWSRYEKIAEVAHSEYLQAGAELGMPGLLMAVALAGLIVYTFLTSARAQSPKQRAATLPLFSAIVVLLVHAAVDFPLHIPPLALLAVLLGAGLRVHGVTGPSWVLEFRFRRIYGVALIAVSAFAGAVVLRSVIGFWYYLGGVGAPRDLLHEKWSLESAPRREVGHEESVSYLAKAVAIDPRNAPYNIALGGRYFQARLRGSREETWRRGLYHANLAAELNPNNFRYAVSLGEAMESLYRIAGDPLLLEQAVAHYRRAVELAPTRYMLHEKFAMLAEETGEAETAEKGFREAVRLEPYYLRGWFNLGSFLARRGDFEGAARAFRTGRKLGAGKPAERDLTGYERVLVDFDMELFENRIKEIEESRTNARQS